MMSIIMKDEVRFFQKISNNLREGERKKCQKDGSIKL